MPFMQPADEARIAPPAKNPCPECPFNRAVKPGTLGGSPVETYIGQIYGPFVLACHMHIDYKDTEHPWDAPQTYADTMQCAGAAIMRANLGVAERMPEAIPKLPADHEKVFSTMGEFAVHHMQLPDTPKTEAIKRMADNPTFVNACLHDQMKRVLEGRPPK